MSCSTRSPENSILKIDPLMGMSGMRAKLSEVTVEKERKR